MESNTEKIQINLSVEDLEEWNESWKQPSLLAIKLQQQLLINRILSVCLFVAIILLILTAVAIAL